MDPTIKSKKSQECTVCSDNCLSLECKHFVCKKCIVKSGKQECPLCKQPVSLTVKQTDECQRRHQTILQKQRKLQIIEDRQVAINVQNQPSPINQPPMSQPQEIEDDFKAQEDFKEDVLLFEQSQRPNRRIPQLDGPEYLPPVVKIKNTVINMSQVPSDKDDLILKLFELDIGVESNCSNIDTSQTAFKLYGTMVGLSKLSKETGVSVKELAEMMTTVLER